jgi:hypothetical protein
LVCPQIKAKNDSSNWPQLVNAVTEEPVLSQRDIKPQDKILVIVKDD